MLRWIHHRWASRRKETIIIIKHNIEFISHISDYLIDLGTVAGQKGGNMILQGFPKEIMGDERSSWFGYEKTMYWQLFPACCAAPFIPAVLKWGHWGRAAAGIAMVMELLALCDEVWVFGEATEGMAAEIASATAQGKEIIFKDTEECKWEVN